MPKLNVDRTPIKGTELIKLSRGYIVIAGLGLLIAFSRCCFFSSRPGRNPATIFSISIGLISIISLITALAIKTPLTFWGNLLKGNFSEL